jgi:parallel beta-helix repeat protein
MQTATTNTITGNTTQGNTNYGMRLDTSSNNTITGNTVRDNGFRGVYLNTSSNGNNIASNSFYDNGAATTNQSIVLSASDSNSITGNVINDTSATTNNYAIDVSNNTSDTNYLADNTLGGGSVNDLGTGTVFGGQTNVSGNYVVQPAGTVELMNNTNVTGTLNVTSNVDTNGSLTVGNANQFVISNTGVVTSGTWNGSAVSVQYGGTGATTLTANGILFGNGTGAVGVTAAGTTGQCLLATTGSAPTWGTCTATNLQGTYNASSPATIDLSDNKNFTINAADTATDSSIVFNLQCVTCSASGGRFAIQDAGVDIFTVNPNGDIVIGTASNNVTFVASNGYKATASGTARNSKKIRLHAEYPSVVLNAGSLSGANLGTMTSGYDSAARMNYYNWTTTQGASQDYDVVVQVPLPKDFSAWDGNTPVTVSVWSTTTTANSIQLQLLDSGGTAPTGYDFVDATPGSTSTWTSFTPSTTISGTYTDGDYITLRLRLKAPTSGNVRIGNITLNYLSKF